MDVLAAIQKRRSIRSFDCSTPVSDEDVARILEAGRLAPSWKNDQPWRFVVVRSAELRSKIADTLPEGNPARTAVASASVVLVLLGVPGEGAIHQGKPFYLVDCGIAGENMYLELVELGLAAVWVSLLDGPAVCRLLGAPADYECVAVLPIGYAAEGEYAKPGPPRKSRDEVCFFEQVGAPLPF